MAYLSANSVIIFSGLSSLTNKYCPNLEAIDPTRRDFELRNLNDVLTTGLGLNGVGFCYFLNKNNTH